MSQKKDNPVRQYSDALKRAQQKRYDNDKDLVLRQRKQSDARRYVTEFATDRMMQDLKNYFDARDYKAPYGTDVDVTTDAVSKQTVIAYRNNARKFVKEATPQEWQELLNLYNERNDNANQSSN